MTRSKNFELEVKKDSWSCWQILHQYSDKAIKACVAVLILLCFCLIAVTITMASKPAKVLENDNFARLQQRMLPAYGRESSNRSCELIKMVVHCQNTSSIYSDVYHELMAAPFTDEIVLNIESQHFPNHVLSNKWIASNKSIHKVTINNSYFNSIRNEAFNCPDFTNTIVLKILGVKLSYLTNGVFLGLSKLQYLRISGSIERIHRCFFQPIQYSLIRLKLNGEMKISGDENIFGISVMPKLSGLDLSDNDITGVITRHFFYAVPNVKYLTISNSKIRAISSDAFDDIAKNLEILDLSNNLLTSIDTNSFERIFAEQKVKIYLLGNAWTCKCNLKPLMDMYNKYENRFGDIPYCVGPPNLYGVIFTNVSFRSDCSYPSSEDISYETSSSNGIIASPSTLGTSTIITPTAINEITTEISFQMRCLSLVNLADDNDSSDQLDYFHFDPPCHEFNATLLQNNSVKVVVKDAVELINIIWFSDDVENISYTVEGIKLDYNCENYNDDYLIIDNLSENSTYTFCLVPVGSQSITPFNCLPLYIPIASTDEEIVWISSDDKQFTVVIVCVIFGCSIVLGGAIAYFGIKSYPDLLEGSSHVLVVKKSDQTCYVSTITEGEYIINHQKTERKNLNKVNSLKKIPLSEISHDPFPEMSFNKLPAYELPTPSIIGQTTDENEDHYELPAIYNKIHQCGLKCIPNKYAISPTSPPPLPKRNSDNALHRFNQEFYTERPHPKMSI